MVMIPRRSAWLLALLLSLWFRSDVNFAPKKHMDAGWEEVVEATHEVSSATKHLMKEPFSPENAASWAKVTSGQVLRGVNAVALPARWSLQIASATLLAPLSLRLQRLAKTKPPGFARAQMHKACDMLKVDFKCPELFMLEVGEAAIQTLPLNAPKGKVDWAVFVSSHLTKVGTRDQLLALLLREVSLLRMRVPPLPQLWVLLAAAKPTPSPRRPKAKPKTKGTKVVRKGETQKKGLELGQLQQHLFHTLQELCRIHLGIHALRVRLNQLPTSWRSNVAQTAGRFQLPGVLGDGADVIGSYADGGLMASLYQAGNRVEDYMGRYQPMRIGHIALLKEDLLGKDKTQKSLMKQVRDTRAALDRVYSIGPERVEGLLEKASKIRHPRRFWRRKPRRNLHLVELWEWAFVGKAICDLSGGATEYAIPCREQRAAKVIRDHLEYLYHLGIPIIPEAAELIRRLQSAATLAIHLRAAEPDWSECLDSVISSSFAAPMDSDLAQMTSSQLQEERLDLEQLPPGAEPRVGDLLISHPLWSVLQAPFDYSVLLVAADGLTGVTGLRLNQPEGQTLEQLLVASDQELPKFQAWMRKKPVSLGGPLMSYSEVESLYWIHSKNMDISFCGDLEAMQPSDSLRFFRGCAKWSSDQLSVDLERGFWIHARPQRAQSLHSICFDNVLATRDVWYAAMLAAVGPVLAEFPRGPAADPILKQALVNHYRAQATDIARQLFGPRSAEWDRRLEAAKLCKAK